MTTKLKLQDMKTIVISDTKEIDGTIRLLFIISVVNMVLGLLGLIFFDIDMFIPLISANIFVIWAFVLKSIKAVKLMAVCRVNIMSNDKELELDIDNEEGENGN